MNGEKDKNKDSKIEEQEEDPTIRELETNLTRFLESLDKEEIECFKNLDHEIKSFHNKFI